MIVTSGCIHRNSTGYPLFRSFYDSHMLLASVENAGFCAFRPCHVTVDVLLGSLYPLATVFCTLRFNYYWYRRPYHARKREFDNKINHTKLMPRRAGNFGTLPDYRRNPWALVLFPAGFPRKNPYSGRIHSKFGLFQKNRLPPPPHPHPSTVIGSFFAKICLRVGSKDLLE